MNTKIHVAHSIVVVLLLDVMRAGRVEKDRPVLDSSPLRISGADKRDRRP